MTRVEKGLCALCALIFLLIAGWVLAGALPPKPIPFSARGEGEALPAALEKEGRFNLNTCSVEDLAAVPGLGEETARLIVQARDREPFHFIEDVRTVRGVGEKRLNKLKNYAYVE